MNLLEHEAQNVERMLEQLLEVRYRKLVKTVTKNQKLPTELLTVEEAKMCETFADFTKSYRKFSDDLKQGQLTVEPIKVAVKVGANTMLPHLNSINGRLYGS